MRDSSPKILNRACGFRVHSNFNKIIENPEVYARCNTVNVATFAKHHSL